MVQKTKILRNKHQNNPNSYLASQRELFVDVKSLATRDTHGCPTHSTCEKPIKKLCSKATATT